MSRPIHRRVDSVVGSGRSASRLVNATASTLTVTKELHDGSVITLNRAAGIDVTLPSATGSGASFTFIVGKTFTGSATIKVVGNDVMAGRCIQSADGGNTVAAYETAADSDTITMDGSTTGGLLGDVIELIDIAADTWFVNIQQAATGTEATPFSATVS